MFRILNLNPSGSNFYALMGPIFGSRSIAKEVGISIYDDPGKQFFVAMINDLVVGTLSVRGSVISDCYTMIAHRQKGILSSLLSEALIDMNYAKSTCTPLSRGVFEKAGFNPIKELKNFTVMEYKKNA